MQGEHDYRESGVSAAADSPLEHETRRRVEHPAVVALLAAEPNIPPRPDYLKAPEAWRRWYDEHLRCFCVLEGSRVRARCLLVRRPGESFCERHSALLTFEQQAAWDAGAEERAAERIVDMLLRELPEAPAHIVFDQRSVDALLHPNGKCRCCGEGRCDWCLRTAEAEARMLSEEHAPDCRPEAYNGCVPECPSLQAAHRYEALCMGEEPDDEAPREAECTCPQACAKHGSGAWAPAEPLEEPETGATGYDYVTNRSRVEAELFGRALSEMSTDELLDEVMGCANAALDALERPASEEEDSDGVLLRDDARTNRGVEPGGSGAEGGGGAAAGVAEGNGARHSAAAASVGGAAGGRREDPEPAGRGAHEGRQGLSFSYAGVHIETRLDPDALERALTPPARGNDRPDYHFASGPLRLLTPDDVAPGIKAAEDALLALGIDTRPGADAVASALARPTRGDTGAVRYESIPKALESVSFVHPADPAFVSRYEAPRRKARSLDDIEDPRRKLGPDDYLAGTVQLSNKGCPRYYVGRDDGDPDAADAPPKRCGCPKGACWYDAQLERRSRVQLALTHPAWCDLVRGKAREE